MTLEKLTEEAKKHGIKIGFLTRGLYKLVADMIPEGEAVRAMAEGLEASNKAPVVVTDKAVYISRYTSALGGPSFSSIPLEKITSATTTGGVLATLTIAEGTGVHKVDKIPAPKAFEVVRAVRP